ncbi:condensation domain-containing protein [Streptomyces sp. NPDC006208]|uniref:condensation domain-containing protein n=1 Tax=Streptomyces sp. NPDC006208 TaxID=3156734 RepID=UPI0033AA6705
MRETLKASWNHRHRLGQTREDAERGVFNPHHSNLPLTLHGALDLEALNRAWHALQIRHPVLLSGFDTDAALWHVGAAHPGDMLRLPAGATEEDDLAAVRAAVAEPFDLVDGPVARLVVLPRSSQETYFALVTEHLVSDGWSLNVLIRDLAALYGQETGAPVPELPPIELTFQEFVRRQNTTAASADGRSALSRLAERLDGIGAIPAMPINGFTGATGIRYERNAEFTRRLPKQLCHDLAAAARPLRLTGLNLMHAALHQALFKLSDRPAVATTLSTANRELPGLTHTAGWFASKTVLASEPGRFSTAPEYLRHFRERVLVTLDDSHLPWPALIDLMDSQALGRQSTVPYVTFNARPIAMRRSVGEIDFPGVATSPLKVSVGWHDASIATFWDEDEDGITVAVMHKTDWYTTADVLALWDTVELQLHRWAEELRPSSGVPAPTTRNH